MEKQDAKYTTYLNILKEELVPAMGCTEPIAIAYAAAKARAELGHMPDRIQLQISGSIIKNVKSVIVPNTGGQKGIEAAAMAGIVAGRPEKELEVLSVVDEAKRREIKSLLTRIPIQVEHIENGSLFEIVVTEYFQESYVKIKITDHHTNIEWIEKNHEMIYRKDGSIEAKQKENAGASDKLNIIWLLQKKELRAITEPI